MAETGQPPRYSPGDVITFKKKHPCGSFTWEVLRAGADLKLKCAGCGRLLMMERRKVEKARKRP